MHIRIAAILGIATFVLFTPIAMAEERTDWLLRTLRDSASQHVMVVAHRADWHGAPENSLAGIANCIDMGVDAVELDFRRTRDGHFVVMHDKTIDRTTNGVGRVEDLTLEQLRSLRLRDKSGAITEQSVPTLEQVIDLTRGKVLVYLDKTDDNIDVIHRRLAELNATGFMLFYGKRAFGELQGRFGDLPSRINYLPKLGDDTANAADYIAGLAPLKPAAFILDFETEDSNVLKLIPKMRQAGARIWASPLWPAATAGRTDEKALTDPDANWGWLLDQGVTIFCTDRPRELLAYLDRRGLRDPASRPMAQAPQARSGDQAK